MSSNSIDIQEVKHPNPSYYQVIINNEQLTSEKNYLVLSQSFDSGWKTYEVNGKLAESFPFIFGTEIKDHVLVNNWQNGWAMNKRSIDQESKGSNQTIVIYYLPQLLEYLGFGILGFGAVLIVKRKR